MTDERTARGEIPPELLDSIVRHMRGVMPAEMPVPHPHETADQFYRRMQSRPPVVSDRALYEFQPHLRTWFESLSPDDVKRLDKVIGLSPKTIDWISEKNERELQSLDGAVEFITSSRTAARVLMWVCGMAVTFVGGVVALAKSGIDLFAMLRGGR